MSATRVWSAPRRALRRRTPPPAGPTLSNLLPGSRARLVWVSNERALTRRLAELGLLVGAEIEVVQATGGALVVAVRGSRLAVGRALADRLGVERLDSGVR